MRKRSNNDLVLVNEGNKKLYFVSMNKAGLYLGLQANSVKWAIQHQNVLRNNNDEEVTIKIVDGTNVTWGEIYN